MPTPITKTDDSPDEVLTAPRLELERLTAKYTSAQTNTVLKTVAAGKCFVVTAVDVFCDNGNTVDVSVLLEFDDTTDVTIVEHPGVAPGSGFVIGDGSGQIQLGDDGQNVIVTVSVPTGGSVTVHVSGYLIDV
jgi:hypothetical protein